jgi:ribonuclease HI
MNKLMLFIDGSVHAQTKIGYGAHLVVAAHEPLSDSLTKQVNVKRFEHTSSTKLELQTLLWVFDKIDVSGRKLIVYTDSQNIIGLPERRARLEQNDYRTRNHKRLNHYELYQEFYRVFDAMDCEFVKVKGHKTSNHKDDIDRLFTLVDRASRMALREDHAQ